MTFLDIVSKIPSDAQRVKRYFTNLGLSSNVSGNKVIVFAPKRLNLDDVLSQFNGVVIDWTSRTVLCRTTRVLRTCGKIDPDQFDTYRKFNARDGTVLNLYYDDKWIISSTRNMDIGDTRPIGLDLTYCEAIDDILTNKGINLYPMLNIEHSYTIGITHPHFHPLQSIYDIWLIAEFNTDGENLITTSSITLDKQLEVQVTYAEMVILKNQSLYMAANKEFHFGFIIETPTSRFIEESVLMTELRHRLYNNNVLIRINNMKKMNYLCLVHRRDAIFKQLFPCYTPIIDDINISCAKIVQNTIKAYNKESYECSSIEMSLINKIINVGNMSPDYIDTYLYCFVNELYDYLDWGTLFLKLDN